MNKIDLTVRLSLSVLTAGLVSCAKDEKTRDVFHAPPPVINSKGSQDLKTWDRRSDKSLDLQDSFDVSASRAAKLLVTSRCRLDQRSYVEEFSFHSRAPLKIFQVLPTDLLTADLKNKKHDCAFELVLINHLGSKHIYQIPSVPITDEQRAGIKIELTGTDDKIDRFSIRKLEGLRARLEGQGDTEILCTDVTIAKLPFTRVIALGSYDFTKAIPKKGRPLDILQENPLQTCRILLLTNQGIEQLSDRVHIQFTQSPLIYRHEAIENPPTSQKGAFFKGAPLNVAAVSIGNTDRIGKRKIVLEASPGRTLLEIYSFTATARSQYHSIKYLVNEQFLRTDVTGMIEVPAGGFVRINVRMQPTRPSSFAHIYSSDTLAVSGGIPFVEIDKNGATLATGEIPLLRTMLPGGFVPDDPQEIVTPHAW